MAANKSCRVDDEMEVEVERVGVDDDSRMVLEVQEPEVACLKEEDLREDEQKLWSLLPVETWMNILNKLDLEDKEKCANAVPYFRKLLQDQRVVYLFPKVIEAIASIYEQKRFVKISTAVGDHGGEPTVEGKILDSDEWKKSVLNCRLVCSTWNKAIENRYERSEMTGIPEFLNELHPRAKSNNWREINWTKQNMSTNAILPLGQLANQFFLHFERSHHSGIDAPPKNPFLGRHLSIIIDRSFEQLHNGVSVTQLMETFGKEIWYLELKIVMFSTDAYNLFVYETLRSWLSLVPNLKYLLIHKTYPLITPICDENGERVNVCLPKLDNLKVLCVIGLGAQIASELVRKNCHVNYLRLEDLDEVEEDIENSVEMANLRGFASGDEQLDNVCGDNLMGKVGPRWKNLNKLGYGHRYTNSRFGQPSRGFGAPEAFEIFQRNWIGTLTDVRLEFPFGFHSPTILEESKALRLNLPGVRKLTLCVFRTVFLDFLLPLKQLEHLELNLETPILRPWEEYMERVEEEQEIQLFGFENRMDQSNIWDFFENMKTIMIKLKHNDDVRSWRSRWEIMLFTKEKEKFKYLGEN